MEVLFGFSALMVMVVVFLTWKFSPASRMLLGGIFANLAYWAQDGVERFDGEHEDPTSDQVWSFFLRHNKGASRVREWFPRTPRRPVMVIVTCMDGRLDTNEFLGDTRRFYYVLRLAGSVIDLKEMEMLELAVRNGVKVVLFTRHTDCAAEKVAADPERAGLFPEITNAIQHIDVRIEEFISRPFIRAALAAGTLAVKVMDIDTHTEQALVRGHLSIVGASRPAPQVVCR